MKTTLSKAAFDGAAPSVSTRLSQLVRCGVLLFAAQQVADQATKE